MICKVCNKETNEFYLNDVFGIKKHSICYNCFNEFPLIKQKTIVNKLECLSLYAYQGKIKDLIYQFKGLRDYELKDVFLEFLIDELELKYFNYVITYAPSFYEDDLKRGFNHVEAIFSKLQNKKIKLFSKKYHYKQSDQKYNDRSNINKVIELDKTKLKDVKKVLIVDDVLTSGNTLKSCSSLLHKEGIHDIKLLTVSKVVEL